MSDSPAVRRVRINDADRARSIRFEALSDPAAGIAFLETREHAQSQPDEFWQQRTAAAALSDVAAQFIAEAGRDCVGTLTVLIPEPGTTDYFGRTTTSGRAFVVAVYVRPSHRGSGTLEALMDAAADWARGSGVTELALDVHQDNVRAQRAYARWGLVRTGVISESPNGPEIEMVRAL